MTFFSRFGQAAKRPAGTMPLPTPPVYSRLHTKESRPPSF